MCDWELVDENNGYGIAIHNFRVDSEEKLNLNVGERVHMLYETDNWYYGYSTRNRTIKGIFPRNYIHIIDISKENKQPQIVAEITSVLREWGTHWKNLYVTHNKNFEQIKNQIYDLIRHRSKILSGTLPVDELKQVKKQVTSEIDTGNKILGLDLVVRDKDGNIINPDETSTIRLYHLHKAATERIQKATTERKESPTKTITQQYSHIFCVTVRNFVCKMSEDAELLMTMYDAKEGKAITENYVVRWSREGLMSDIDQMNNLRVLFTDLGSRDLKREKVYLVCYVVRVGSMDIKETDHRRSSIAQINKKTNFADCMRRPFGVAALDITLYLCGKIDSDLEQEFNVPFFNCDKDNLEGTLKKIITNKDFAKSDNKGQSLFISLKLLHGDLKQVREEHPHLILGNVAIARKMGFPEVILPGDVRNDLYLTLLSGEFSKGNKKSDKNVEVVVKVCNEKGQSIPGVISLGGGAEPLNQYKSVIYYHEDKPRWHETFKVAIPIEEFKNAHLKFTFRHRSSNEAKDKSEKPFAMSYVKLMQPNGTTLKDVQHDLLVYKIDHKKYTEDAVDYFKLPVTEMEMEISKPHTHGLTYSNKDSFTIATNVCSTKLTQNVDLLGLLNWITHRDTIEESLTALMKVDGEEVVKFLQDVLDALFGILMDNPDSDDYDKRVFECLLYIIGLVSDRKYQHFQPVLDLYITESYSATLAYDKLIVVMKQHIDEVNNNINEQASADSLVFKSMKSLQYIMKFIVKSRMLFAELHDGKGQDDFVRSLKDLLLSINKMMCHTTDSTLLIQGACMKYLPSAIPDILKVFNAKQLSTLLANLLKSIPPGRLTKQKMMTVNDIVHSQLFSFPECRQVLMPVITKQIKELFETSEEGSAGRLEVSSKSRSVAKVARVLGTTQHCLNQHRGYCEEVELCVKILSDILELLFRKDIGQTLHDITEIMLTDLRTVIQYTIAMDREHPLVGNLVAIMIAIFRKMTNYHYDMYINHFATRTDVLDFLMEILLVFKDLVNRSVFPSDWCDMIMLQNHVILKSLRFFSHTIRDRFFEKFDNQAWNNFFHCTIAFLTQPSLQLENFSQTKYARIVPKYKDMRREAGYEIRSMWFNLGQYKIQFVPALVSAFLEMTLIPEPELRKATIPMFFDMMQAEFYSSRLEFESFGDTKRDSSKIKAHFSDFENEMIAKLDILVEGGKGDEHYKTMFHDIMMDLVNKHTTMRERGSVFVKMVTRLMERLLEYRCIINDENKENRMSCTVNLLDFYSEINRKELYIRYVNKLCDLHLEVDNFTEAAYTLQLHSNLLNWSDELLPPLLKSTRYTDCQTHRQLKESLYFNMIELFEKGKMWECSIQKCKEIVKQHEEVTYEYEQLSNLHQRLASFYEKITKMMRPEPEYFRVAYYGRGFPTFLQNKVFIYRGKEYERLSDFSSRTMNQFPNAELMNKLTPPGTEITESNGQYIQINKVDPVMEDPKRRFSGKPIAEQIIKYYKVNNVQKFRFSRPFIRKDPYLDNENEFANLWLERTVLVTTYPLPGILTWFPVTSSETYEISPLINAIETMENTNKQLKDLITAHIRDDTMPINPLSMKLNGIVDPAVMGGLNNYEEAFFTNEYMEKHPDDVIHIQKLQNIIADQIPLLEMGISVHRDRAPPTLLPLQKRLEDCFVKMRDSVVEKYGKGSCDIKFDNQPVTIRRQLSILNENKIADLSMNSDIGNRSRVSSLTRSQVTSLKNLTASFNFSASPQNFNSKSAQNSNKNSFMSTASIRVSTPSPANKNKSNKTPKEKRRSKESKVQEQTTSPTTSISSATQWYTDSESINSNGNVTPVFELRQELTAKRPLRSEVEKEKRLSRPPSGQFNNSRPNSAIVALRGTSSGASSNRDSVGTTDSTASEEEPPPLPLKTRESDYCNLPEDDEEMENVNNSFLHSNRYSKKVYNKPAPPEPTDDNVPPIPPPKPPKTQSIAFSTTSNNITTQF